MLQADFKIPPSTVQKDGTTAIDTAEHSQHLLLPTSLPAITDSHLTEPSLPPTADLLTCRTKSNTMAEGRPAPLRLGSIAPNFQAETTTGPIDFHEFIGDKWVVLFSHPEDYTPVCTTELGAFAKLEPEFTKRGVKLIGLSANTIDSHAGWIKDIDEISGSKLSFPIIGDKQRQVAYAYDMLDHQDATNVDSKGIAFTIRSVFIIDPKKTIRLILSYPASTGRNTAEVLRVVDSLQTGDKNRITTPINWVPGDDVIVHPSVSNELAKELFPDFKIVKPYLRFTPLPKEKTSAV
ncbi:thioredoxin-like protein [Melanomma pulvis-pyrius CBS 109.77]|uniref:Thioredoxin-like protein n=1 Tax=Melanomma pulvis-pyrius CBS 109.77 TaxID=1314802 RepID=A0A6A6WTZ2_9PLEO|nr:thioredoxin-like protein [Melanomma pulvis-pyrius CBS 109.77]